MGSLLTLFGGSAPAPTYATWNPADKGADIVLTGGDLTVSNSSGGSWMCVRATIGKATGKYKIETSVPVAAQRGQDVIVGVGTLAASVSEFVGQNANSWGLQGNAGGTLYHSGSGTSSYGASFEGGGVIATLIDTDAMTLKYRFAGGAYTADVDISALAGSDIYFMCAVYVATSASTTNFGTTAWAHEDAGYSGVTV